jgi:hypothetical protein
MAVLKSSRLEGIEVVFNNSFLPKNRKPNKVVQIEKWLNSSRLSVNLLQGRKRRIFTIIKDLELRFVEHH